MSPYEVVFNQKPRKLTQLKLETTTDELGNFISLDNIVCKKQATHNHLEKPFSRPKLAKLGIEHLPNGS